MAAADFSYAMAPDEQIRIIFSGTGFVYAPVVSGHEAGYAYVCIADAVIGKVPVIYGQTVEMQPEPERSWWQRLFGGA